MLANCVILAGGKSSRMQTDKTLLKFANDENLTQFCAQKYSQIFQNIFVSAKSDKFGAKFRLILDKFDEFSPMGALWQILEFFENSKNGVYFAPQNQQNDKIFIIAADMPFVSKKTILNLYENSTNCDIINPKDANHTHFLCGFFSQNLVKSAKDLFLHNKHKIANLAEISAHKTLFCDDENEFLNINYPKDYENALKILANL